MAVGRFVLLGLFSLSLLPTSCHSTGDDDNNALPAASGGQGGTSSTGGTGSVSTCVSGRDCTCADGSYGLSVCVDDRRSCDCSLCTELVPTEAPVVEPCGGEPFGTWRLTELEYGTGELPIAVLGRYIGSCAVEYVATVPNMLVDLLDGGLSRTYAASRSHHERWYEDCTTSKDPTYRCEDLLVSGSCELACGICDCTLNSATSDTTRAWSRTTTRLTLTLWEASRDYAYCATESTLELSVDNTYMAFERVYLLPDPLPCAERTPEECTLGSSCRLGTCVGEGCAEATSESECLVMQGCSWDPDVCLDDGQLTCELPDYGVVPGCELTNQSPRCVGTPEACDTLDETSCVAAGCTLTDVGRCLGASLPCSEYPGCPAEYCTYISPTCYGTASCTQRETEEACWDMGFDLGDDYFCGWEPFTCEGTVTPCSGHGYETCGDVPGCELERVD